MATKTKTDADAVLEAAGEVLEQTIVHPSDVAGQVPSIDQIEATHAETLDREIRSGFRVILESRTRLVAMIGEAKASNIHKVLTDPATGKAYRSWTAYMENVIASLGIDFKGLGKKDRDGVVAMLYSTGMNQKTIAAATAIPLSTVQRAVAAARADGSVGDVETENRDGSKQGDAKGGRPKQQKTPLEVVQKGLSAVGDLLDQMDEAELLEVKATLAALTRKVNALTKR